MAGYARKVTLDIVVDSRLNPTAHPGKPLLPRKKSSVVLLPLLKYAPRPGKHSVLTYHTNSNTQYALISPVYVQKVFPLNHHMNDMFVLCLTRPSQAGTIRSHCKQKGLQMRS